MIVGMEALIFNVLMIIFIVVLVYDMVKFAKNHRNMMKEMERYHNIRMKYLDNLYSQQQIINETSKKWMDDTNFKFNNFIKLAKENRLDDAMNYLKNEGLL